MNATHLILLILALLGSQVLIWQLHQERVARVSADVKLLADNLDWLAKEWDRQKADDPWFRKHAERIESDAAGMSPEEQSTERAWLYKMQAARYRIQAARAERERLSGGAGSGGAFVYGGLQR